MQRRLIPCLFLLYLANASVSWATEPQRFSHSQLGISIEKPAGWHFQPVEFNTQNLKAAILDDKNLQELLRKKAQLPLVLMTRYPEPTEKFNPSIKVIVKPITNPDTFDPIEVLEFMLVGIKKAYLDAKVVEPPAMVKIGETDAAHVRLNYTLKFATGQSIPTRSEMWLVPRGKYLFLIGTGSSPQDDAPEHAEIAKAIVSLKF